MGSLRVISEHRCFGGVQGFYAHDSNECFTEMRFSVYRPPQAQERPLPVLYYLAGLTCTEETFMIKAGAQSIAAELGFMLVAPDTSPRSPRINGDDASWDFGLGAGFYVDATEAPWHRHYRMYSYVTRELPQMLRIHFNASERQGIFGHSMGGHGALICALRNPEAYCSVSAFAPVAAPMRSPWGQKAFATYLGEDEKRWQAYDASELVREYGFPGKILVDQGADDKFLQEQLQPQHFVEACKASDTALEFRMQPGYDHGYYFISTFMADHLRYHATALL